MKTKLLFLLLVFFVFASAKSQNNTKPKAGIFLFSYQIDSKLTEETAIKTGNKNFFTNFSSSEPIPDFIVDSIIKITERTISKKHNYNANVIYYKNKKGKAITTMPVMVGGLPAVGFKKIIKQNPDYDYYVKVFANLYSSGGIKFSFGSTKYSIIKPRFTLKVVILNKNKKVVSKKTINLTDLTKVRSKQEEMVKYNVKFQYKETEGLTPFDLLVIFNMGMEKYLNSK